jgi:hypothetical protein
MHNQALTRHAHSKSQQPLVLPDSHPAVLEARPLFAKSANEHKRHKARILVSGMNSRKIGRIVTKGDMRGFAIYTLTLTERATCPRDCSMFNACYGNRSPWSLRWPAGAETEARIETELAELQERHPDGFLVRLHVLGDFYSTEYVRRWHEWMERFSALHVFGFTARHDGIASYVRLLNQLYPKRWVIRSSDGKMPGMPSSFVIERGAERDGIACPAQQHKTAACGSCGLCWSVPDKPILFWPH